MKNLPTVRGEYKYNYDISRYTWLGIGGILDVLYKPADIQDLQYFLQNIDKSIPLTILGNLSNVLIRSGGIRGVCIKLGREFAGLSLIDKNTIEAGCACLDINVAEFACENEISGLEFLSTIPGNIGGAVAMNAGCFGSDISNILIGAKVCDYRGNLTDISPNQLGLSYRTNQMADQVIFLSAIFRGQKLSKEQIRQKMENNAKLREQAQPTRVKTIGSTFKNPPNMQAWRLIKEAGCDNLRINNIYVSPKHANFLINEQTPNSADIEEIINLIRNRVFEKTGIRLEPEVKILGEKS